MLTLLLVLLAQEGWRAEEVGEGVVWRFRRFDDASGAPQSVGILDCDPATARFAFAPAAKGLERTGTIAARTRAVAAVNGGYFTKEGKPLGILKIDGLSLAPATEGRGAAGIDATGAFHFKRLPGGSDWPEMRHAMGGVPLLLEDGAVPDMERERAAHLKARHPRTALGRTSAGRVLLVVVDGRTPEAAGMSCAELADFLKGLDCTGALNLDGGGSSTLWIRGKPHGGVASFPCDDGRYDAAGERAVANVVTVTAKDVVEAAAGDAIVEGERRRWRLKVEFDGDYEVLARRPSGRWTLQGEEVEPRGGVWASLGRRRLAAGELDVGVTGGSAEALRVVEK